MVKLVTAESIAEQLEDAFGAEPVPEPDRVLAENYRTSIDAEEMMLAFRGQHWTQLTPQSLFYHREMIRALSAEGYRGYIAAFMRASLPDGPYALDLRGYTVSSFHALEDTPTYIDENRAQLSLLTEDQRAVIASYLRYLSEAFNLDEAAEILASWGL